MSRVNLQAGFVLHTRPFKNTSLLIDLFSRDFGRIGLVAKGVRKKGLGALQAFRLLTVNWSGKGELRSLQGVEDAGGLMHLQGENLNCGFYLNELLLRLLHRDDPHTDLFHAYHQTLQNLHAGKVADVCLRLFEQCLLDELGYGLVLDHDIENAPIADALDYVYLPERGPVLSSDQEGADFKISGRCLNAFRMGKLESSLCRKQIKRLMRETLRLYLGDKPLKSRELFDHKKRDHG